MRLIAGKYSIGDTVSKVVILSTLLSQRLGIKTNHTKIGQHNVMSGIQFQSAATNN